MSIKYRKEIEVTSTGMVIARVKYIDGRCVGLEFFASFLNHLTGANCFVEADCKRAHKWADARIALCLKQEV